MDKNSISLVSFFQSTLLEAYTGNFTPTECAILCFSNSQCNLFSISNSGCILFNTILGALNIDHQAYLNDISAKFFKILCK